MSRNHKRASGERDVTDRFADDDMDEDEIPTQQRFSRRSAGAQTRKIERTALLRAAEEELTGDISSLPAGQVVQVYSLFSEIEYQGALRLGVVRKTMAKLAETAIVVGDVVRFREIGIVDEHGRPEAVIEQVLPRRTVLTRSDSFKAIDAQPIVANADQMLIVISLLEPWVKWGLVDRMLVAAQGGGLTPIICLNKVELGLMGKGQAALVEAEDHLGLYQRLGVRVLRTSAASNEGIDALRDALRGKTTVLAGHSGVGKSTLINLVQPGLKLRTAPISGYTGKGRHTTTSARRFALDIGGWVIDTPGVKLFGLWGVTRDNLSEFFPDIEDGSAPDWRQESYGRIVESLPVERPAT